MNVVEVWNDEIDRPAREVGGIKTTLKGKFGCASCNDYGGRESSNGQNSKIAISSKIIYRLAPGCSRLNFVANQRAVNHSPLNIMQSQFST